MPAVRGKFVLNTLRRSGEPLTEEQRVFADCVDDVLASTPGLRYVVLLDPEEIGPRTPNVYAQFLLETSPDHDLVISIELEDRAFVIRVNGMAFARTRGAGTRFEWWVERRCRDLERLLAADLRITHRTLLNLPVTSTLEAGRGEKWRKIASRENGWVAFLSFLVPYGFILGGKKRHVYEHWFAVDGPA
ncbi:MAG: hypothetical protein ACYS15_02900 [Planctomycetota bacterium]|jgi:hypothetical protein